MRFRTLSVALTLTDGDGKLPSRKGGTSRMTRVGWEKAGRAALVAGALVLGAAAPKSTTPPAKPAVAAAPRPPKRYPYPYSCEKPASAAQDNLCLERRAIETSDKWGRFIFHALLAIAVALFLNVLAAIAGLTLAARGPRPAGPSAPAAADNPPRAPRARRSASA